MPTPSRPIYLCGGDMRPGPRGTDCPNPLHDYPLPAGYVDAGIEAGRRLNKRWTNRRCRDCGIYGWVPSAFAAASPVASGRDTTKPSADRV